MTFTLQVDAERWRRNSDAVRDAVRSAISAGTHHHSAGDLVPVAKGNGYGLGNARLARETARWRTVPTADGASRPTPCAVPPPITTTALARAARRWR